MKVAVIADDFSGAAELAAAAAAMGHSAEVQTCFDPSSEADVLAIDTDTRCSPANDAASSVAAIAARVLRAEPEWIYKKTDSVLRGNVRAEVEAIMTAAGLSRALLVPANPSKGRLIRDGMYSVIGVPLSETSFASDPVHPRRSADVRELLSATGTIPVLRSNDSTDMAVPHVYIPDIQHVDDVKRHAGRCDQGTLAAGGVEFFEALLNRRLGGRAGSVCSDCRLPVLFVCGSFSAWQQGRSMECGMYSVPVFDMPGGLRNTPAAVPHLAEEWSQRLGSAVSDAKCAMAAIGCGTGDDQPSVSPAVLTDRLAEVVGGVLGRHAVSTVCVEGGATAAALARVMRWTRLAALPAPDLPGVAVLRLLSSVMLHVLVKPGSYPWPGMLWKKLGKECV